MTRKRGHESAASGNAPDFGSEGGGSSPPRSRPKLDEGVLSGPNDWIGQATNSMPDAMPDTVPVQVFAQGPKLRHLTFVHFNAGLNAGT